MKPSLSFLLVICMTLTACGGVFFVGGAINAGASSVSGIVSAVQISAIIGDNGSTVQVTFVTFQQNGTSSTICFCGDERGRFPMQQSVLANFTPGHTCSSVVTIVIT